MFAKPVHTLRCDILVTAESSRGHMSQETAHSHGPLSHSTFNTS